MNFAREAAIISPFILPFCQHSNGNPDKKLADSGDEREGAGQRGVSPLGETQTPWLPISERRYIFHRQEA